MNTTVNTPRNPSLANAPDASKQVLEGIQKAFGFIPNLMATFANSPAVLKGYLALEAGVGKERLHRTGTHARAAHRQP